MENKKKFISEFDYNKSATGCPTCSGECKKIDERVNKRRLSEIEEKEVPHILKVFDFWLIFLTSKVPISIISISLNLTSKRWAF